jgi:hypothetical protein
VPAVLVVGDQDVEGGTVGLRLREDTVEHRGLPLGEVVADLAERCAPPR